MTISTSQSSQTFLGNGVTNTFDFSFIGDSSSVITVTYTSSTGVSTVLTPAQYTISLNAPAAGALWGVGGTVTYPLTGSPIGNGTSITVTRALPLTQTTSVSNQGNFYPISVEQALDVLEMQIQQVSARSGAYRGTWATGQVYTLGDLVVDGANGTNTGNLYVCALANTSVTWSTDLAAGDWVLALNIQGLSGFIPLSVLGGKGYIPAGSGVGTATALAPGTNGQAVIFDSTQTSGLNAGGPYLPLTGGTLSGALNEAPWVDVESASTTNIGAAASNNVRITGTTTITSFGTIASGAVRQLRFAGALTLTYNASSLILPTLADIITAAGDTCTAVSLGAVNWIVTNYQRADGTALTSSGRLLNVRYFTTPGASTYTATTGTNSVVVEGWGAGASGARSNTVSVNEGGGAGAYFSKRLTTGFNGVTVTIGAGGAAVTSNNTAGNNGGTTSFGAVASATGAAGGGLSANGSAGGGTATGGDENISGEQGFAVSGASAGLSIGGASPRGGTASIAVIAGGAVTNGGAPGGGGTGSASGTNSGAGADGEIRIWEYS